MISKYKLALLSLCMSHCATAHPTTELPKPTSAQSRMQQELLQIKQQLQTLQASHQQLRQQLQAQSWPAYDQMPIGSVVAFAYNPTEGHSLPYGWLACDGAEISRTDYADLFAQIHVTFGVGDGWRTFMLPDLRGEFIRGWSDGREVDSDRAFGSAQAATRIRSWIDKSSFSDNGTASYISAWEIDGPVIAPDHPTGMVTPGGSFNNYEHYRFDGVSVAAQNDNHAFATRPRNVALLYAIKAYQPLL